MRSILLAAVLVLSLAACNRAAQQAEPPSEEPSVALTAAPTDGSEPAEPPTPPASPAAVPTAAPTDPAPQSDGQVVELFFLRTNNRGDYFFMEPERWQLDTHTPAVAKATLELLLETQPRDPSLESLLPQDMSLLGVVLKDGTLTVNLDFPDEGVGLGSSFEGWMYAELVHTGAQFSSVKRVRVLDNGQPPASGHLEDPGQAQRPDPFDVAPVVVDSPQHQDSVPAGKVTFHGTANVFEATVVLKLKDDSGNVVQDAFTTATCGTGCRGDWEHQFTITQPGRYTLIAAGSDASDGEGPPPFAARRRFTVD
jgi:hypothetical protein